jgi:hypothetical protein
LEKVPREFAQRGQASAAAFTLIALTLGFEVILLSATAMVENSIKFAWQLLQERAVSGDVALHLEQVCKAGLRWEFLLFYLHKAYACNGLGVTNGLVCLLRSIPLFSAFARRVRLLR